MKGGPFNPQAQRERGVVPSGNVSPPTETLRFSALIGAEKSLPTEALRPASQLRPTPSSSGRRRRGLENATGSGGQDFEGVGFPRQPR